MMPDRENVIENVETAFDIWIDEYEGTSYYNIAEVKQAKKDALALLKEQEEEIENLKQTCQSMMEGVCLLKEQEAVVRCKDCKHQNWVNAETGCIVCKFGRGTNAPDWFCADGELR